MNEALKALLADLQRLADSGNVRPDGESLVTGMRLAVGQLLDADAAQAEAAAKVDPVDVQLSALSANVEALSVKFTSVTDLVDQLAKLAGDLQAATVKAGA